MVDAGDWESEANERIDRLRKRDVTIQVKLVGDGSADHVDDDHVGDDDGSNHHDHHHLGDH